MIYDISPPISERLALFPEDTRFEKTLICKLSEGASVNLFSLKLSPHVGAHADAPYHYDDLGTTIDRVPLEPYLGECWVIDCAGVPLIEPEHCEAAILQKAKRVLFKTLSYPQIEKFNETFTAFSPRAVESLGKAGVRLIGIDTPSIDPAKSKELPSHRMLKNFGMYNLEGLLLSEVPAGRYELIALPLRLVGLDASPVRAILRRSS